MEEDNFEVETRFYRSRKNIIKTYKALQVGGKEVWNFHESGTFWKNNFEILDRRVFARSCGLLNSGRNGVNKY